MMQLGFLNTKLKTVSKSGVVYVVTLRFSITGHRHWPKLSENVLLGHFYVNGESY